ncbi:hypothetical protein [Deinococcus humi]|uniref:FlgD Ig-like domain-containing protein n=1 Tax=Deinococcus humi TaxID=662880 RepID=A0A7W8JSM1_9DEIO|nr:hypothetical protein [Deinococcus humi]MBB5362033.1 hypothetical protein [Deinococcus humi]GGO22399.1 hypothetical protein GCM10008949_09620 [Deinococcus humi]
MYRPLLLTLALLGGSVIHTQAHAQVSVADIPALPLSGGARPSTPAAPAPATPVTPSTVTTLPAINPPLNQPHTARLEGPQSVQAGQTNMWTVLLTNTGDAPISLQHGACDVKFEVLNAAGQVVRAAPQDTICTLQIVPTNVAPGETGELQKIRWEGRNDQNQPVPAGTYTIRSVFNGDGVLIRPADFMVAVR